MEESGDQFFSRQPITLTTWDVVAIVAYFITILAVGLSVRKMNKVPQYHCYVDFFPFQARLRWVNQYQVVTHKAPRVVHHSLVTP